MTKREGGEVIAIEGNSAQSSLPKSHNYLPFSNQVGKNNPLHDNFPSIRKGHGGSRKREGADPPRWRLQNARPSRSYRARCGGLSEAGVSLPRRPPPSRPALPLPSGSCSAATHSAPRSWPFPRFGFPPCRPKGVTKKTGRWRGTAERTGVSARPKRTQEEKEEGYRRLPLSQRSYDVTRRPNKQQQPRGRAARFRAGPTPAERKARPRRRGLNQTCNGSFGSSHLSVVSLPYVVERRCCTELTRIMNN